jgi:cytochrome c oxidase subunit 3
VTWAHHAVQTGDRKGSIEGLALTVCLAMCFTAVQAFEYTHAPFTFGFNHLALLPFTDPAHISLAAGVGNFQAIYGSTFFMATGFHGCHVIIGTIFLAVCLGRAIAGQFTPERHFGFEAAAWYWHFVDVVWLFLFSCIYVWGASAVTEWAG